MLIVAVAMTFVITTGGIDLSVGSTVALVNALAAIALQAGIPWPLVVALMLALGAAIGAAQGWFIAFEGIPAFIVTLAGSQRPPRHALLLTQGYSMPIPPTAGSSRSAAAGSSASRCRRSALVVARRRLHRAHPDALRPLRHRDRRQCRGRPPRRASPSAA